MCGRFGLWATPKQVADHFQLQESLPFTPRYNIAPSQEILAVGKTMEGKQKATWLRWGLVPLGQGRCECKDCYCTRQSSEARGQRPEVRGQ